MSRRTHTQPDQIASLLSNLLGRQVEVSLRESPLDLSDVALIVATYADPENVVAAACVCDLTAGASLGAALSLIPANRVEDSVAAKQLEGTVKENLREVCNVMVSLFNHSSEPSLSLTQFYPAQAEPERDLAHLLEPLTSRLDLDLDISGYGSGKLSCYTC